MNILCLFLLAMTGMALTILTLRDFGVASSRGLQFFGIVALVLLSILLWHYTEEGRWALVLLVVGIFPSIPFLAHVVRGVLLRAARGMVALDRVEVAPSFSRAELAERRQDFDEAERLYREVARRERRNPRARRRLAQLLAGRGRLDEAIEEYRGVLKLLKAPADMYVVVFEVADILAGGKGDIEGAIAELEAILAEYPKSSSAAYAHERLAGLRARLAEAGTESERTESS